MADLLIDIGNTNLKWAWLSGERLSQSEAAAYRETGVAKAAQTHWREDQRPHRVLLASVAGDQVAKELRHWLWKRWSLEPEMVVPQAAAFGVTNGYDEPGRLGVDRWLALIAVRREHSGPVCIVDCGTAITIDVLDGEGRHQGGLILPGFQMMREALLTRTGIPPVEPSDFDGLLATNTQDAIRSGALHAAAALVERVWAAMGDRPGCCPKLLLTGSGAPMLGGALSVAYELDSELVMRGLSVIAQGTNKP